MVGVAIPDLEESGFDSCSPRQARNFQSPLHCCPDDHLSTFHNSISLYRRSKIDSRGSMSQARWSHYKYLPALQRACGPHRKTLYRCPRQTHKKKYSSLFISYLNASQPLKLIFPLRPSSFLLFSRLTQNS